MTYAPRFQDCPRFRVTDNTLVPVPCNIGTFFYIKWNPRFFQENLDAYNQGHAATHPAEGWYKGEIGFFDFYIIPLAKKLKDCGVFGVSSGEYVLELCHTKSCQMGRTRPANCGGVHARVERLARVNVALFYFPSGIWKLISIWYSPCFIFSRLSRRSLPSLP
jgi:hypothetical protein